MTKLIHRTPCKQCPFRRAALPGWLGDSTPQAFIHATMNQEADMPCHTAINYNRKGWEERLENAQHCAGSLIFLVNTCKVPKYNLALAEKMKGVKADIVNVFQWSKEFVDHHNRDLKEWVATAMVNKKVRRRRAS